jgi:Zn-dependent protease with chaperone function
LKITCKSSFLNTEPIKTAIIIVQQEIGFDERRFRKRVIRAVFAIASFALVYLVLVACAAGLMVLLGYLGIQLMVTKFHPYTVILGLAMMFIGGFVLWALVRFLFESQTVDESHLREVSTQDEPRLHALIAATAEAAGAELPRRVFVSGEINAQVYHDSTFWGMFLPVRKNLVIGLGLVEALSTNELRAVLAHEFGHFSQRSMRLGTYRWRVPTHSPLH